MFGQKRTAPPFAHARLPDDGRPRHPNLVHLSTTLRGEALRLSPVTPNLLQPPIAVSIFICNMSGPSPDNQKWIQTTLELSTRLEHIWNSRPPLNHYLRPSWRMLWDIACPPLLAHLSSAPSPLPVPPFAIATARENDRSFRSGGSIQPDRINPVSDSRPFWLFEPMHGFRLPPPDSTLEGTMIPIRPLLCRG